MTTEQSDDCTCVGCGHLVARESMLERDADATPYEPVDVDDVPGVASASIRTVRVEHRCPECTSAPAEPVIIQ